ncbi:histidine phosphatase family protein [Nocardioides sp.]|uniref:histidine phosphatase family protein n=1 Tax=Nocardioides sp. TaxID=35761 RepID=UPI00271ADF7F|nr:histidine phosphatase family protein [Nocardioides sp.]MDO9456218.1 histidine phosphatase family protein [Nocardioides sp.]
MAGLVVVTHPEATHVVDGLVGGWYDADLTERGARQATRIADALATSPGLGSVDAVVSSDLRRCRRTADTVGARLGLEVRLDPDLREQSYGAAEGHPPGTFAWTPPGAGDDPLTHHDGVEGSETRLEVATRVYAAVERVLTAGDETTVVITHGGAATYVVAAWIGMPLTSVGAVRFSLTPGSISRLTEPRPGERRVESLDGVAHLA